MQISTLIEASAEVTRIVTLKPGDVYKRLPDQGTYDTNKEKLRFGVIQSVLNNGTDTAITAIEFVADYRSISPEVKTFRGNGDLAVWAATPAEITIHLGEVLEAARAAVVDAERALAGKQSMLAAVESTFSGRASLTAPETVGALTDDNEKE